MVYSSHFVLAVLVDGVPQKESNGIVPIQFSKNYELRFRNKNDRRAVVKFTIDGENVSGDGYIIPANSFIDIRRHWAKDATFKFVDLNSSEAVDHGKNGPNFDGSKGIIEARFYLEEKYASVCRNVEHYPNQWYAPFIAPTYPLIAPTYIPYQPLQTYRTTTFTYNSAASIPKSMANEMPKTINCLTINNNTKMYPFTQPTTGNLQEGCTVEGGVSGQTFISTNINLETNFVLLRCTLKGLSSETSVPETYCTTCGARKTRPADNFCGVCGKKF